jgi:outer membrane protein TolC
LPIPLSTPSAPLPATPAVPAQPIGLPASVRAATLAGVKVAEAAPAHPAPSGAPGAQRITLEQARERVLSNSKLLELAAMNIQGKESATRAVFADYFPKILGDIGYLHFDRPLGTVVTVPGFNIAGPAGASLLSTPGNTVTANVFEENSYTSTLMAAQPITALLKVRQGVKIARADEQIAQAQLEQGARALAAGVDQLYWGLVAAQRIRAGTLVAVAGAEQLAKLGTVEARSALLEARQGLQAVENQIADLEAQLNSLLDQPACTKLEVVEPPFPPPPVSCGDEAVALALQASPEVREAQQNVVKAQAATAAAKVDYLPNVAVIGGYANQNFASYIQPNFGYVGVTGTWTLFEWGKRKHTVRERETLIAMAALKVRQVEDEVRDKALKAFREFQEDRAALTLAEQKVELRKEAEKEARAPADRFAAAKARMEAEVDLVKADLAYRIAHVKLMALLGKS